MPMPSMKMDSSTMDMHMTTSASAHKTVVTDRFIRVLAYVDVVSHQAGGYRSVQRMDCDLTWK